MRKLKWNEEYVLSFVLDGRTFSTPCGRGYLFYYDAKDEKTRLKSKGATNIRISIRTWN